MNDFFGKVTESYKNIYSQLRVSVSILSLFIGICFFLIKYAALVITQNEYASLIYSILFFSIVFIIASIIFLIMALDELHDIDSKNKISKSASLSLSIVKTYKSLALLLSGVLFEVIAVVILIYTSIDFKLLSFLIVLVISVALILIINFFPEIKSIMSKR